MSENIVIQLIVGFVTIIGSILAVTLILARKLGNGNSVRSSQQKRIDNGLAEGTKTLATRFDDQVSVCNQRWLDDAKIKGKIEAYMIEIRDRLERIEGRP